MSQPSGENSHFVGSASNLSPPSPAPQPNDKGTRSKTVNINIDDDDGVEANKSVKKRYWTNDEEVRLAILSFYNYVDVVFAGQRSRFVLILPFFVAGKCLAEYF
jgi:hypothetical protein